MHPLPDFILRKIFTDKGGLKSYITVSPPAREIIHSLKLVDYFLLQADKPWYNYYMAAAIKSILSFSRQFSGAETVKKDRGYWPGGRVNKAYYTRRTGQ